MHRMTSGDETSADISGGRIFHSTATTLSGRMTSGDETSADISGNLLILCTVYVIAKMPTALLVNPLTLKFASIEFKGLTGLFKITKKPTLLRPHCYHHPCFSSHASHTDEGEHRREVPSPAHSHSE